MIEVKDKVYKLQGKEFYFEKPCLKLTERLDNIQKIYELFENEDLEFKELKVRYKNIFSKILSEVDSETRSKITNDSANYLNHLEKYPELKKEITEIFTGIYLKQTECQKRFLRKYDNVYLLLTTCLKVKESDIDFNVENEGYVELMEVAEEVLQDFFYIIKN